MLDFILALLALWGFCNTKYFEEWSQIHIGGNQLSFSLTALIVLVYLGIGAFGSLRWYYFHNHRN